MLRYTSIPIAEIIIVSFCVLLGVGIATCCDISGWQKRKYVDSVIESQLDAKHMTIETREKMRRELIKNSFDE